MTAESFRQRVTDLLATRVRAGARDYEVRALLTEALTLLAEKDAEIAKQRESISILNAAINAYERNLDGVEFGSLTPCEPCPLGIHAQWFVDAEDVTGCPACLLADARARIEAVKKWHRRMAWYDPCPHDGDGSCDAFEINAGEWFCGPPRHVCSTCSGGEDAEEPVPYPCPTVAALGGPADLQEKDGATT